MAYVCGFGWDWLTTPGSGLFGWFCRADALARDIRFRRAVVTCSHVGDWKVVPMDARATVPPSEARVTAQPHLRGFLWILCLRGNTHRHTHTQACSRARPQSIYTSYTRSAQQHSCQVRVSVDNWFYVSEHTHTHTGSAPISSSSSAAAPMCACTFVAPVSRAH